MNTQTQIKKILIVDDEKDMREMLTYCLEDAQHRVIAASNGAMGLTEARAENPDLIILDMKMPVLNGQMFLEEFYKVQSNQNVPIIVISGQGNIEEKLQFRSVIYYFQKPFVVKDVINIARRMV